MSKNSYTFKLTPEEQQRLADWLHEARDRFESHSVPYTQMAVAAPQLRINLYNSGKCLVQGKLAEEWVLYTLEPLVLQRAGTGYEELLSPHLSQPHMGIDESGKGDFFGPLVIASAYVDEDIVKKFNEMGVRDSKTIKGDKKMLALAADIRQITAGRFAIVKIGPRAYNRLYAKMGNVNRVLAWGHARAIENLLEKVPDCPRAVADQFGPEKRIKDALLKAGQKIQLEQRPKAEDDPAVAAASILARAEFVREMDRLGQPFGAPLPKGASDLVKKRAGELIAGQGPEILLDIAKCHFRTTGQVLQAQGLDLSALPEL